MIDYIYDIDIHIALVVIIILSLFITVLFCLQFFMNRHTEMLISKLELEKLREINGLTRTNSGTSHKEEKDKTVSPEEVENDENSESKDEENKKEEFKKIEDVNRKKLMNLFTEMSCNPHIDEQENLALSYQGENFLFMFNGPFIRIWDFSWHSIKLTDDNFTLIKDAVNYANFSFGPSIVMHSPDEEGNIVFSSRIDIPLVNLANDMRGYVEVVLDSFFSLKQSLTREVSRLKTDPQDRTLHDNPIGFDTASLSDPTSPQAN